VLAALWPVLVYGLAVLLVVGVMIGLSHLLGERHRDARAAVPYESGIVPAGSAQSRFHVRFYLVAVLFVVFDLEAVFLYLWVAARREVGWPGFLGAAVFTLLLLAALAYLWRRGLFSWGEPRRRS